LFNCWILTGNGAIEYFDWDVGISNAHVHFLAQDDNKLPFIFAQSGPTVEFSFNAEIENLLVGALNGTNPTQLILNGVNITLKRESVIASCV